jgi:hypothetical protein
MSSALVRMVSSVRTHVPTSIWLWNRKAVGSHFIFEKEKKLWLTKMLQPPT